MNTNSILCKEQTYAINDREITAAAYFLVNHLCISEGKTRLYECSLDDYTNFTGNMECFVNEVVRLKNDGLSRSKIYSWINALNTKTKGE